jgi:hypothetical protein
MVVWCGLLERTDAEMDWMLEATLTESAADEKGMENVTKLYEGTSMMTAMADFGAVLRFDLEIEGSMVERIVVKAIHCETCGGNLPDYRRCEGCGK